MSSRCHDRMERQIVAKGMSARPTMLITCVGAYDDSGVGTGGFVCLHEGRTVVIDKRDSTGLCLSGDRVYRFVRSQRSIIGYDLHGVSWLLRLNDTRDVHDLMLRNGRFITVATGQNRICWHDPFGGIIREWKAEGERDAWHLNCLCEMNGRLCASAFGEFSEHRGWLNNCRGTGFVFDLDTGEKLLTDLNGPHSPRWIDGSWYVCESHGWALSVRSKDSERQEIQLEGFTRGMAYDEDHLYVGESANRKDSVVRDFSHVVVIDRRTLRVVERVRVPFPEIYEIVLVPPALGEQICASPERYALDAADARIRDLEHQVERGFAELEIVREELRMSRARARRGPMERVKRVMGPVIRRVRRRTT